MCQYSKINRLFAEGRFLRGDFNLLGTMCGVSSLKHNNLKKKDTFVLLDEISRKNSAFIRVSK